jgi:hypothetical protein
MPCQHRSKLNPLCLRGAISRNRTRRTTQADGFGNVERDDDPIRGACQSADESPPQQIGAIPVSIALFHHESAESCSTETHSQLDDILRSISRENSFANPLPAGDEVSRRCAAGRRGI